LKIREFFLAKIEFMRIPRSDITRWVKSPLALFYSSFTHGVSEMQQK